MKILIIIIFVTYCLIAVWMAVTYNSIKDKQDEAYTEGKLEGIKIGRRLMGGY